jgi:hypothetical protein
LADSIEEEIKEEIKVENDESEGPYYQVDSS